MKNFSILDALRLAKRGVRNYVTSRPLVISYEVTLSCNCNCLHCDLGGARKDEKQLGPTEYANLTRLLNPPVVQISGGEPLLRRDIVAVAKAIKQSTRPYLILVTNGVLLSESNYLQLYEAGVNQFSVSLDFPDERHDEFRGHPGLYRRLERVLPQLAQLGHSNIILNTVITRANLREIMALGQKAVEWGVAISYSAYTALRTGNNDYSIHAEEDLKFLRQSIYELMEARKGSRHIANSKGVLLNTLRFFEQGYMPDCKAGIRFFVVMPDGSFIPCSLHRNKYSSQREMIENFSQSNTCGACYVAIRSYSEPQLLRQLREIPHYRKRLLAGDT
jgi:MoaA/NifB/PqqE/SkfB family radical SAM enzyme